MHYDFTNYFNYEDWSEPSCADIVLGPNGMADKCGLAYEVRDLVRSYLDALPVEVLERMAEEADEDENTDCIALDLHTELEDALWRNS